MRNYKNDIKNSGFTLIELLVVIAIIALLLAVLLPSLRRAKQQAQSVVCKSNLRQWGTVFHMYTQEYNGEFQAGYDGVGNINSNWWMDAAVIYYDNIDEFRFCPTATKTRLMEDGVTPGPGDGKQPFMAWGHSNFLNEETNSGSYGINAWLENNISTQPWAENHWRKITNVKSPSQVPTLSDAQHIDFWPNSTNTPPATEDMDWTVSGANSMTRVCQNRHRERQNMLFVDFSVETIGLKQLWTFKWHREYDTGGPYTRSGGVTYNDWPEWMADFEEY